MNDRIIEQAIYQQQLSPITLGIVLGVAFLLGMLHTLGPGHGKSLMAAYLVGSSGRIRDALILGLSITISHVFSVILFGLAALLLMDYFWSGKASTWISLFSGVTITAIGFWLLYKRLVIWNAQRKGEWKIKAISPVDPGDTSPLLAVKSAFQAGSHQHDHSHSHTHSHHHPDPRLSLWSNITLGISSGIVPCPKALVIMFLAISLQKVVLGIVIVSVFSLGVAAVLVMLGIVLVKGSHLLKGRWENSRLHFIPVTGASIIIGLGILMTIRAAQLL